MLDYAASLASGLIVIFGGLLFAFSRRQNSALSLQLLFAYLATYYLFFILTHLVNNTVVNAFAMAIGFIEGPLLLWVVRSYTIDDRKPLSLWHYAVVPIVFIIALTAPIAAQDPLYVLVSLSRLIYGLYCVAFLWGVRNDAKGTSWIGWVPVLIGYVIILAVIKLASFSVYHLDRSWHAPDWVLFSKTTGAALVILALLWWALIKPDIYKEIREAIEPERTPSDFDQNVFGKLTELFETEELFTHMELNIAQTAERLAVTNRELSEAVNKVSGKGFRALLREYRIKRACEILSTHEHESLTILEVALQSGFATKSVFNAAFLSETGLTPSAYKMRQLN